MNTGKPVNIDQYISLFPADVQEKLEQIRAAVAQAAPGAEEAIKYAMPTFVQDGNLIHFAAFKKHIGIYPAPTAIKEFAADFARYKTSKGAVQLPLDEPVPVKLITRIVKYNIARNKEAAALKKKKQ